MTATPPEPTHQPASGDRRPVADDPSEHTAPRDSAHGSAASEPVETSPHQGPPAGESRRRAGGRSAGRPEAVRADSARAGATRADAARARRVAEVFGEVLPAVTSDELGPGRSGGDSEAWYRENRPPHHDRG